MQKNIVIVVLTLISLVSSIMWYKTKVSADQSAARTVEYELMLIEKEKEARTQAQLAAEQRMIAQQLQTTIAMQELELAKSKKK